MKKNKRIRLKSKNTYLIIVCAIVLTSGVFNQISKNTLLNSILNSFHIDRFAEAYDTAVGFGGTGTSCSYTGNINIPSTLPPGGGGGSVPYIPFGPVKTYAQERESNLGIARIVKNQSIPTSTSIFDFVKGGKKYTTVNAFDTNNTAWAAFDTNSILAGDYIKVHQASTLDNLNTITGHNLSSNPELVPSAVPQFTVTGTAPNRQASADYDYVVAPYEPYAEEDTFYSLKAENIGLNVATNDFDPNNDPIVDSTIVLPPATGIVTGTGANKNYTPSSTFGTTNFTASVKDSTNKVSLIKPGSVTTVSTQAVDDYFGPANYGYTGDINVTDNDYFQHPVTVQNLVPLTSSLVSYFNNFSINSNGTVHIEVLALPTGLNADMKFSYDIIDTVTGEVSKGNLSVNLVQGSTGTATVYHAPVQSKNIIAGRTIHVRESGASTVSLTDSRNLFFDTYASPVVLTSDSIPFTTTNNVLSQALPTNIPGAIDVNFTTTGTKSEAVPGFNLTINPVTFELTANSTTTSAVAPSVGLTYTFKHGFANKYNLNESAGKITPQLSDTVSLSRTIKLVTVNDLLNRFTIKLSEGTNKIEVFHSAKDYSIGNTPGITKAKTDLTVADKNSAGVVKSTSFSTTGNSFYNISTNITDVFQITNKFDVNTTNCPPLGVNDNPSTPNGVATLIDVLANDEDFEFQHDPITSPLTLLSVTAPSLGGTATIVGNKINFVPASAVGTTDTFSYTFVDAGGLQSIALVSVAITASNGNPVVQDDNPSTFLNTPVLVDVLANDTDPNNDPLTICIPNGITQPAHGVVTLVGNKLQYSPDNGYFGPDTFAYIACDGNGGQDGGVVRVSVNNPVIPTNQPPTTPVQTITIKKGDTLVFPPYTATDPDNNNPVTFTTSTINPLLGCTQSNAGQLGNIISCNPSLTTPVGDYTFTVTPKDALNLSGTPVTYTVKVVNPDNVKLEISKNRPDTAIAIDQDVVVETLVSNPNSFILKDVVTDVTIDSSKVSIIDGSPKEGSIIGQKYADVLNLFSIEANAATGNTIQIVDRSTLKITTPILLPNQSLSFVFNLKAKTQGIGTVSGATSITSIAGIPPATDQTNIPIEAPQAILVRTGGQILLPLIFGAITIFIAGAINSKVKPEKSKLKRKRAKGN
jgi:hypothetical protein